MNRAPGKTMNSLYSVTISSGTDTSEAFGPDELQDADGICIYFPALTSVVLAVYVSFNGSDWFLLNKEADILFAASPYIEGPSTAFQIPKVNFKYLRFVGTDNESEDRTIYLTKGVRTWART